MCSYLNGKGRKLLEGVSYVHDYNPVGYHQQSHFVKLIIILKHKNIDRNNSRIHDLNFPHFLTSKQPTPKSAGNSNYSNFVTYYLKVSLFLIFLCFKRESKQLCQTLDLEVIYCKSIFFFFSSASPFCQIIWAWSTNMLVFYGSSLVARSSKRKWSH